MCLGLSGHPREAFFGQRARLKKILGKEGTLMAPFGASFWCCAMKGTEGFIVSYTIPHTLNLQFFVHQKSLLASFRRSGGQHQGG